MHSPTQKKPPQPSCSLAPVYSSLDFTFDPFRRFHQPSLQKASLSRLNPLPTHKSSKKREEEESESVASKPRHGVQINGGGV